MKNSVSSFSLLLLQAALIWKASEAFSVQPRQRQQQQHPCNTLAPLRMLNGRAANAKGAPSSPLLRAPPRPESSLLASIEDDSDPSPTSASADPEKVGFGKRVGSYFKGSETDDGLTFRQRLAKMGLATVLSYGWISNTNAMILVSAAWYVFSAKVRIHSLPYAICFLGETKEGVN